MACAWWASLGWPHALATSSQTDLLLRFGVDTLHGWFFQHLRQVVRLVRRICACSVAADVRSGQKEDGVAELSAQAGLVAASGVATISGEGTSVVVTNESLVRQHAQRERRLPAQLAAGSPNQSCDARELHARMEELSQKHLRVCVHLSRTCSQNSAQTLSGPRREAPTASPPPVRV